MENNNIVPEVQKRPLPSKKIIALVIALVIALAIAILAFANKGLVIAAVVNGTPISRLSIISDLEKSSGKKALDTLVSKTLIYQEASKEKVTVTQKEIDDEIAKINDSVTKQGQKLDDVLKLQGLTKSALMDQIKTQKLIEKMLSKDITVTDKEITDYIASNSATLPKDAKPEELNTEVKNTLTQQKMQEKFTAWLDDLHKQAKINYFVTY